MGGANAQELIRQLKRIKQENNLSYNGIMEELTVNGVQTLSLTTLRRVFAADSEEKASSFNYETTLLPISEAVRRLSGDTGQSKEVEALHNMIRVQSEAIDRIITLKDQLAETVNDLAGQIKAKDGHMIEKDALIRRLIDRLDQKDAIIQQFLIDLKQRDEIINKLTNKYIDKE